MSDIVEMVNTRNLIIKHLEITEVQYLQINKVKGLPRKLEKIIVENNLYKLYEKKRNKAIESTTKPTTKQKHCAVAQIHPETKEVLKVYRTMKEAAEAVNVTSGAIKHYFNNKSKVCGGFEWKKLQPWGKCKICGFEGEYKEHFSQNGIKNGYQQYKKVCRTCFAAGKHKQETK